MRRKLFLLLCAVLTCVGTWATDYTNSLPTNGTNWDLTSSGPWVGAANLTLADPKGECSEMSDYKFAEVYYGQNTGTVFEIYKTITVPNGTYIFQMAAFGRRANVWGTDNPNTAVGINGEIFAGDAVASVTTNTFKYYTVTTTVTNGSLTVGLRAKDGNLPNWWGYTDATLVKIDGETNVDLTRLLINPNALNDNAGWTAASGTVTRNARAGYDGVAGFFEPSSWGNTGWDATYSQTISNLPNGYYKIQAAGQLVTASTWQKLSVNGYESYFNPNGDTGGNILSDGSVTTIGDANAYQGWRYNDVVAKVTDGTLAISIIGHSEAVHCWANFDNLTLTYLGSEATSSSPMDVTGLLKNASLTYGATGWTCDGSGTFDQKIGTNNAGWGYEFYHGTRDLHQALSGLPCGRYAVSAQVAWRDAQTTQLYATTANGTTTETPTQGVTTNDPQTQVANMYADDTWGKISVNANVTDGNLTVGLREVDGGAWTVFDNFRLLYYGPNIAADAVALNGAMSAGTWYYFDVLADGEYNLTVGGALNDIVYTKDATVLIENQSSVTTNFSGTSKITLTAGRYYVKSTAGNSLTVVADIETYDVGTVTAQSISNGEYIKSLNTLVLTYGDATTSDSEASLSVVGTPTASLQKGGEQVATGVLSADASAKTLTATFSDVELAINSTDYSIVIPAGAFGYEGESTNAEVTVTFNTPLFADGTYYLKNKDNGAYFAAGGNWSSQSITNNVGHVLDMTAFADGKYSINTHINNGGDNEYLGESLFCDGAIGTYGWTFTSDGDGGYTISNATGYLKANAVGATLTQEAEATSASKWILLTAEEWLAGHEARLDAASLNSGVDATFYLPAANFSRNDNIENAKWQGGPNIAGTVTNFNAQKWNVTPFDIYQELSDLKPGVYKLNAQGFYRNGTTDDRNALLYANDYSVQLVNIRSTEIADQDNDKGFTTANGDYYVPNVQDDASKAFDNGYYDNELELQIGAAGTMRFGVKKTEGADYDWTVVDNFRLTYYGGPIVQYDAVAFLVGGALTAGTWYYYDIPADDNYRITSSVAGTLTYTTNGRQLTSGATGTDETFTAGQTKTISLTEGRVYFKVSDASTITLHPSALTDGQDVTAFFITNPSFETGTTEGWKISNGTLGVASASDLSSIDGTYYQITDNTNRTTMVSQTVSGLPIGYYVLTARARAANNNSESVTATLGIGDESVTVPFEYEETYKVAFHQTVADADATISFGGKFSAYGKFICDNFTLTYYTTLPNVDVTELLATKMNATVLSTLTDANTAYSGSKTEDNYNTLQDAIIAAQISAELFAPIKVAYDTYHDKIEANLTSEGQRAFNTAAAVVAYTDGTYATGDNSNEAVANIRTAYINALKAYPTDGADMTDCISNWDFTDCSNGNFPGWTITAPNGGNTWRNSDTAVEYWIGTAGNGSFSYSQTLTGMPAGKYKVSGRMFNSTNGEDGASFDTSGQCGAFAESYGNSAFAAVTADNVNFTTYESAEFNATSEITLGVKNNATMTARWFVVDWVKLTYVSALDDASVLAGTNDYEALNNAINSHELGFLKGQYAPYTNRAGATAVADAKVINQDVDNFKSVVNGATVAITRAEWTANTEDEMDAVSNGSFSGVATQNIGSNSFHGWLHKANAVGLRQIISNEEKEEGDDGYYAGLTNASAQTAMYIWAGTTEYGTTNGYTMPLEANTKYVLQFKAAGWTGDAYTPTMNVKNPAGTQIATANVTANTGIQTSSSLRSGSVQFTTSDAGNYTLELVTTANAVFTDVSILRYSAMTENAETKTKTYDGAFPASQATITPSADYPIVDISGATFDGDLTASFASNENGFIIATDAQRTAMNNPKNVVVDGTCANLVITDGLTVTIPESLTEATSATYTRTLPSTTTVFGTICLPYSVTSDESIQYYSVKEITSTGGSGLLKLKEENTIDAGVPAIFSKKTEGAASITALSSDASISGTAGDDDGTSVKLVGTFTAQTINGSGDTPAAEDCYYIKSNMFYQGNVSFNVAPYRAYIDASGSGESGARPTLRISIDSETAIDSIKAIDEAESLEDGKYLIGGKIIVVKNGKKYSVGGMLEK